jgi:hypothetical protein
LSQSPESLPNNLELAQAFILAQRAEFELLLAQRDSQIATLKEQLRLAAAHRYGRSSEKYVLAHDGQGQLFDEAELAPCGVLIQAIEPDTQTQQVAQPYPYG